MWFVYIFEIYTEKRKGKKSNTISKDHLERGGKRKRAGQASEYPLELLCRQWATSEAGGGPGRLRKLSSGGGLGELSGCGDACGEAFDSAQGGKTQTRHMSKALRFRDLPSHDDLTHNVQDCADIRAEDMSV